MIALNSLFWQFQGLLEVASEPPTPSLLVPKRDMSGNGGGGAQNLPAELHLLKGLWLDMLVSQTSGEQQLESGQTAATLPRVPL